MMITNEAITITTTTYTHTNSGCAVKIYALD